MEIKLNKIVQNPHRNLERNPTSREQIESLKESFERNGVWANVVVRENPDKKGEYQLAYGHNRLAAMRELGIKSSTFIVETLSDWAMYTAMVDENESQRNVTPELIYENIEAGIAFIEPKVRECESLADFLGFVDTDKLNEQSFSNVKHSLEGNQGLGTNFLQNVLVGSKTATRSNIQTVVDSHYQNLKSKAKQVKAEAKQAESDAKQKQADAEADASKAKKLQDEVEKLEKQAKSLENDARKLNSTADQETLLMFENAYQMRLFAEAVKANKIPRDKHQAIAKHLLDNEIGSQNYRRTIDTLWLKLSGKWQKQASENARQSFKEKHKSVSVDEFAEKVAPKLRALAKEIDAIAPYAHLIENLKTIGLINAGFAELRLAVEHLNNDEDVKDVTPNLKLIEG